MASLTVGASPFSTGLDFMMKPAETIKLINNGNATIQLTGYYGETYTLTSAGDLNIKGGELEDENNFGIPLKKLKVAKGAASATVAVPVKAKA